MWTIDRAKLGWTGGKRGLHATRLALKRRGGNSAFKTKIKWRPPVKKAVKGGDKSNNLDVKEIRSRWADREQARKKQMREAESLLAREEGALSKKDDGLDVEEWLNREEVQRTLHDSVQNAMRPKPLPLSRRAMWLSLSPDELRQAISEGALEASTKTYNGLLHCLAARGELEEAEKEFEAMIESGVGVDNDSFAALFLASLPRKDAKIAKQLFRRMAVLDVKPDANAYGAYVRALANAQDLQSARVALYQMQQEIPAEQQTADAYNGFLKALVRAKSHQEEHTEEFWKHFYQMRFEGVDPNIETYIYAAKACSRKGEVERAMRLFEEMKCFRIAPTPAFFTEVLRAAGRSPQYVPENANIVQEVLEVMAAYQVFPDAGVFNAAINAIGMAGDTHGAEALYDMMQTYGIEPNRYSRVALVNAYARSCTIGKPHGTMARYQQPEESHVRDDLMSERAIYGAQIASNFEIDEEVTKRGARIRQRHVIPPSVEEIKESGKQFDEQMRQVAEDSYREQGVFSIESDGNVKQLAGPREVGAMKARELYQEEGEYAIATGDYDRPDLYLQDGKPMATPPIVSDMPFHGRALARHKRQAVVKASMEKRRELGGQGDSKAQLSEEAEEVLAIADGKQAGEASFAVGGPGTDGAPARLDAEAGIRAASQVPYFRQRLEEIPSQQETEVSSAAPSNVVAVDPANQKYLEMFGKKPREVLPGTAAKVSEIYELLKKGAYGGLSFKRLHLAEGLVDEALDAQTARREERQRVKALRDSLLNSPPIEERMHKVFTEMPGKSLRSKEDAAVLGEGAQTEPLPSAPVAGDAEDVLESLDLPNLESFMFKADPDLAEFVKQGGKGARGAGRAEDLLEFDGTLPNQRKIEKKFSGRLTAEEKRELEIQGLEPAGGTWTSDLSAQLTREEQAEMTQAFSDWGMRLEDMEVHVQEDAALTQEQLTPEEAAEFQRFTEDLGVDLGGIQSMMRPRRTSAPSASSVASRQGPEGDQVGRGKAAAQDPDTVNFDGAFANCLLALQEESAHPAETSKIDPLLPKLPSSAGTKVGVSARNGLPPSLRTSLQALGVLDGEESQLVEVPSDESALEPKAPKSITGIMPSGPVKYNAPTALADFGAFNPTRLPTTLDRYELGLPSVHKCLDLLRMEPPPRQTTRERQLRALRRSEELFESIYRETLSSEEPLKAGEANALLTVYANCGLLVEAMDFLETFPAMGVVPDNRTLRLVLRMLSRNKKIDSALKILDTFEAEFYRLQAEVEAGKLETNPALVPDEQAYGLVCDGLARRKRGLEALDVVHRWALVQQKLGKTVGRASFFDGPEERRSRYRKSQAMAPLPLVEYEPECFPVSYSRAVRAQLRKLPEDQWTPEILEKARFLPPDPWEWLIEVKHERRKLRVSRGKSRLSNKRRAFVQSRAYRGHVGVHSNVINDRVKKLVYR